MGDLFLGLLILLFCSLPLIIGYKCIKDDVKKDKSIAISVIYILFSFIPFIMGLFILYDSREYGVLSFILPMFEVPLIAIGTLIFYYKKTNKNYITISEKKIKDKKEEIEEAEINMKDTLILFGYFLGLIIIFIVASWIYYFIFK